MGDVINILAKDEDPWWRGELRGVTGMVYKEFVEPVTE